MSQFDVAAIIWNTLRLWGVAPGPLTGILGNMEAESALIPDRWESDNVGNMSGGYGLVQWTPARKLMEWAAAQGMNPGVIGTQLARLRWEADNGQQFYKPGTTFWAWLKSDITPEQAADDFVRYYERPAVINTRARQTMARNWYDIFATTGPVSPTSPTDPVDDLAQAVLRGEYGNGADRENALGTRYAEVQARVNRIDELAQAVLRGEYGNGADREAALGSDYSVVQARVNQLLG